MAEPRKIRITVNGQVREGWAEPRRLLVDFFARRLGLTGTHVRMRARDFGACTVLLNGEAAGPCLMLAVQADGAELMTVEGAGARGKLHSLQEAFWEHHGLQCGLLHARDADGGVRFSARQSRSERGGDSRGALRGTLPMHRYQGIVRAVKAAAERMRSAQRASGKSGNMERGYTAPKFPSSSTSRATSSIATWRKGRGERVAAWAEGRAYTFADLRRDHQPLRQRAVRARRRPWRSRDAAARHQSRYADRHPGHD